MSNKQESAAKPELKSKIYSQASNDFVLPTYEKRDAKVQGPHNIESAIIVKGGANVAFSASNKTQRDTTWAVTEVTAKELETLKSHAGFMRRVNRGFITFEEPAPAELKADKSAQMTEKQMKAKAPAAKAKTGSADD